MQICWLFDLRPLIPMGTYRSRARAIFVGAAIVLGAVSAGFHVQRIGGAHT
jgi:hypothetical protein